MFHDNMCVVLRQWRAGGDKIVLMMDSDKNFLNGMQSRILVVDDVKLKEAVHSILVSKGPKTYFRGSELIVGIWYMSDLELRGAAHLSFDADMRDYWPVLANFTQALILGVNLSHIVHPTARRLNSQINRICDKCIKDLEEKFKWVHFLCG